VSFLASGGWSISPPPDSLGSSLGPFTLWKISKRGSLDSNAVTDCRHSDSEAFKHFKFVKFNVDKLSQLQKITLGKITLPTLRFFKDGEMTKELVGTEQCLKLLEVLEELKD
jgi:hypothetical protein